MLPAATFIICMPHPSSVTASNAGLMSRKNVQPAGGIECQSWST